MADLPIELVEAAAHAMRVKGSASMMEQADAALRAIFAKLPECKEVVVVLTAGFKGSTQSPGTLAIRAARSLAQEFGGQE